MLVYSLLEAAEIAAMADAVIAIDRICMAPVLSALGIELPERKRRRGLLRAGSRVAAASLDGDLVGYLSWGPDFETGETLYIDSVQVLPEVRTRMVFSRLCALALTQLPDDGVLRTDVQSANPVMRRMLDQLGFELRGVAGDTSRMVAEVVAMRASWGRIFRPG